MDSTTECLDGPVKWRIAWKRHQFLLPTDGLNFAQRNWCLRLGLARNLLVQLYLLLVGLRETDDDQKVSVQVVVIKCRNNCIGGRILANEYNIVRVVLEKCL